MKAIRHLALIFALSAVSLNAERQQEALDRGLVAVPQADGSVFLSWRWLGSDSEHAAFHVYQKDTETDWMRMTESPLKEATCFRVAADRVAKEASFAVRAVVDGKEEALSPTVTPWQKPYWEIPIQPLEDYRAGDASVGDLDGDGQYEIVLHQTSRGRDNSHEGVTGRPVLDAYEMDGRHLWRIDLGMNIREGEHYTQFMVYDLDGDGRAEIACKTADGTTDGKGTVIGDGEKDWRFLEEGDKRHGRILEGPEYFTIFDGLTGAALKTVDYLPSRDPIDGWGGRGGNGGNDSYGNRCDRFLACVAYLDGKRPSVVMCRGVYGRIAMVAWDWRDGVLSQRWMFDSGISYPPYEDASPFSGMGGHSLSVGDIDRDGRDEIVYQAMVVDDDGKGLYSTGRRHGDSMHLSDFDPERPGQELFLITENEGRTVVFQTPGAGMHDARNGEVLWAHSPGVDVRQGLVADIDPRHPGAEAWGGPGGLRTVKGEPIGPAPRSIGFALWWDGDRLRELLGRGGRVMKWNWEDGEEEVIFTTSAEATGSPSRRDRRRRFRRPNLIADLLGDWREEILLPSPQGDALRVFTTTIPSRHRVRTLMHDSQYRLGIAWQNVVYNKPAHPSFFLGEASTVPE